MRLTLSVFGDKQKFLLISFPLATWCLVSVCCCFQECVHPERKRITLLVSPLLSLDDFVSLIFLGPLGMDLVSESPCDETTDWGLRLLQSICKIVFQNFETNIFINVKLCDPDIELGSREFLGTKSARKNDPPVKCTIKFPHNCD